MSALDSLTRIPLRKLFLITVTCKIAASFLAWRLSSPWILGFTVPLAFMGAYIVLGFLRAPGDVSDDRFGDSCYYLGFVFTISSIAFSLFDIPDLDKTGRLSEVAVRFGAAMISTFVGFIVRVYLVGFRQESNEAMESLETQIIESANRLRTRLELSQEAFQVLEEKTRKAVNDIEARVHIAAESVGRHLTQEMAETLKAIASNVQTIHTETAQQTRSATLELIAELSRCTRSLAGQINNTQEQTAEFVAKLDERLRAVTFPDDYFTRELAAPLSIMAASVGGLSEELKLLKESVQKSVHGLSQSVKRIEGELEGPVKALSTAMSKLDVVIEAPQSIRDLVFKQEAVAKEVLASMTVVSRALVEVAAATKGQHESLVQIVENLSDSKSNQTQLFAEAKAAAAEIVGSQKAQTQVIENLGRTVKQLESIPASIQEKLARLPTQSSDVRIDHLPMASATQLSMRPADNVSAVNPIPITASSSITDNTRTAQHTKASSDRSKLSRSSFWSNIFNRDK